MFGHSNLLIGHYLKIGIWLLEFLALFYHNFRASKITLCKIPLLAKMPWFFTIFIPHEKSKGFPKTSVTFPPASSAIIDPAAWSQMFSLYPGSAVHGTLKSRLA